MENQDSNDPDSSGTFIDEVEDKNSKNPDDTLSSKNPDDTFGTVDEEVENENSNNPDDTFSTLDEEVENNSKNPDDTLGTLNEEVECQNTGDSNSFAAFTEEVFVKRSPVSLMKQKGNLTGNVRLIRDHVAKMNECILECSDNLKKGIPIFIQLKDIVAELRSSKKPHRIMKNKRTDEMEQLIEKLKETWSTMNSFVKAMRDCHSKTVAIHQLECSNGNEEIPMFYTWPAKKFVDKMDDVCKMYEQEDRFQQGLIAEILPTMNLSTIHVLGSAWSLQPYIEESVQLGFLIMMKECGLVRLEPAPSNI